MTTHARDRETAYSRQFRQGDAVRNHNNGENCEVIFAWGEWLWLNPVDYRDAAPFTGRVQDYDLIRRG
jgi:hypothetical protein